MRLLFAGDVIGNPGRRTLDSCLPRLKTEYQPDFVIVNAENAAGGFGLTSEIAQELYALGADILTTGNHIWDKKQILDVIDADPRLLRPANYPEGVPGRGWGVFEPKVGGPKLGVLNLEGRVYMHNLRDPFTLGRELVRELRQQAAVVLVDFHAEITSEKRALGWYLDGLATAVIGTHTHVQTADEEILPQGTAYLTDAGMTGGRDSVIGIEKQEAINRFLYQMPGRFTPAGGRLWFNGVFIDADEVTGRAREIKRIQMEVK
jgi:2',3'-cyclic-nucleotide 2'-phosphodiesterase